MSLIPLTQKFHSKDGTVDTTERRSAKLMSQVEVYTMGDVVDTVIAEGGGGGGGVVAETTYDTKALMVADTDISDGDVVATRGYTTTGDGGGCIYTVSSSGVADGGSVIALDNGLFAATTFESVLCPVKWGAISSSSSDASTNVTAMNAMFAYYAKHSNGSSVPMTCIFTPGKYYINATVNLPQPTATNNATGSYFIDLNNSLILSATAADYPMLHRSLDTSLGSFSPSNYVDTMITICNGEIRSGGIAAGGIGLAIEATYSSHISNVNFGNIDVGLKMDFCLGATVSGCLFGGFRRGAWLANGEDYGLLTGWGTTDNNNQCNRTRIEGCRWYGSLTSETHFYTEHSGGIHLEDCIFEGNTPTDAVVYADLAGNTVTDMYINNVHVETTTPPLGHPMIELYCPTGQSCKVYIDGIYGQYAGRTLVDASDFVGFVHYNASYHHSTDTFSTHATNLNATKWSFSGELNEDVLSDTSYWVNGDMPNNAIFIANGTNTNNVGKVFRRGSHSINATNMIVEAANGFYVDTDNGLRIRETSTASGSTTVIKPGGVAGGATYVDFPENLGSTTRRVPVFNTVDSIPATANETGLKGEIRADASHMYLCISDNNWIKVATTSF